MEGPAQAKRTTIDTLVCALEAFVSDNARSHDVDTRWFAKKTKDFLASAYALRNYRLSDDQKREVEQFRLAEIEAERAVKQKEIDELDSEAAKLRK